VTDLASNTFVFLAMTTSAPQAKRAIVKRQQISAGGSASAAAVVDLNSLVPSATPLGGPSPDNCDASTPLNLIDGVLAGVDFVLDKILGANVALLGSVGDTAEATTNITFSINDGILQWNSPDNGAASFFNCAGQVYAGFPNVDLEGCVPITIGAIAGAVCQARVLLSRAFDPTFTNPGICKSQ
jgi:hypothetical protein